MKLPLLLPLRLSRRALLLPLVIGCAVAFSHASETLAVDPPRLTAIDESAIKATLHVAADARPNGDGSQARPFASVQSAVLAAQRLNQPVRVLIGPGVYRETIDVAGKADVSEPLLVLEATQPGSAVVSGSDVFTAWTPLAGKPGQYVHAWPHRFGWEKNPWPGLMPLDAPGLRRELLFIDGRPLRQVYREADLAPETYWVDEDTSRLVLALTPGSKPAGPIEVSVRPAKAQGAHSKLLRVFERDNVVVRGLVFRHAATPAFHGALQVLASANLLVEDVRTEWNNGVGLLLNPHRDVHCTNVTVRRVHMDHNGFMGLSGGFHDGLVEDSSTDHNNWRGVAVGATGWAPCGWKLSHLERVVIRRHRTVGNHASGGWFDDVIHHVRLEDYVALNNLRSGISVEATEGPLVIERAFLAGNSTGLNLFDSRNTALLDSTVADNTESQVRIAGSLPMAPEALARVKPDWRRHRLSKRQTPTNIVLRDNTIAVTRPELWKARLITLGMRDHAFVNAEGAASLQPTIDTWRASGNRYAHPDGPGAARFGDAHNAAIDLASWQSLSGQDADSSFDKEAAASAAAARERAAGVSVKPYTRPEMPAPASAADALEL